jgi:hypothetical protein
MGNQFHPMQPQIITNALLSLRAQIVRAGEPGLEHVEALLQLRGHNLGPVPRKVRRPLGRAGVARLVLAALRDEPKTRGQLAEALVAAHGLEQKQASVMAHNATQRLRRKGMVEWVGVWRLVGRP